MKKSKPESRHPPASGDRMSDRHPAAVIDIGSTSARMVIAQPAADGHIETLDFLQQAIGIGHDTFTTGVIQHSTIEACVGILNQFNKVIREYGITNQAYVRAIATSAVREAANRDVFVNRIYISCGIQVQVIEDIDVARFTFLSYHEQLRLHPSLGEDDVLLVEIGGGTTEVLHLQNGDVSLSSNFALGSFRLNEMLARSKTPADQKNRIIDLHIGQTVNQIRNSLTIKGPLKIVVLGSDARFAAKQLAPALERRGIASIRLNQLTKLSLETLQMTVDGIALQFGIPYAEAETVGPALRMYSMLAKAMDKQEVYVSAIAMRSGVLIEMMQRHLWINLFSGQVLRPALEVGRRYGVDEQHVKRVARFAGMLFDELQSEHKLTPWHRLLLTVAALLHDIGHYVSTRSHHKHSMYLIRNSELFGLTRKDILIVAMVARYHRRSSPKPTHEGYFEVTNEERVVVIKLAAILRVADAVDKTDNRRSDAIRFERAPGEFVLIVKGVADVSVEKMALHEKGPMFEEVYGMKVRIRPQKK